MLIATFALLAAIQEPQVVDGVIVRPRWVQSPTVEQLTPEGRRDPVRTDYDPYGEVRMQCTVQADGRLGDCRIVALPIRYPELGGTAVDAAAHFRHAERLQDGRPAAGMPVLVRLRWDLSED